MTTMLGGGRIGTCQTGTWLAWLLAAYLMAPWQGLQAQDLRPAPPQEAATTTLGGELRRFLHDEATAVVHFRGYFFDRQNLVPPNNVALVAGGWMGFQSGWFYDTVQVGAVGYTTQPVWAPQGPQNTSNGTSLLKPGGYGFFTLGQAYASALWKGQTFTGFRQYLDELEVNPRDDRELPQTFEAYALRGTVGQASYFAGWVAAIKPRDYSAFINMGEQAGAPNVNAGMALGSVKYGTPDKLQLRASSYVVPDILWSSYGDVGQTFPLSDSFLVRLAGQFAVQGSTGENLLTGVPFGTFWGGLRADAVWGPMTVSAAYTQVGSSSPWRAPYGIWIGYNKRQVLDFNRAGETAFTLLGAYDFKGMQLPGLIAFASATYGGRAVNSATGQPLSENWEYNFDLQFQAAALPVADWLKPLQLRPRVAFVNQYLGGAQVNSLTEYRVTLNYELTWKGPRLR